MKRIFLNFCLLLTLTSCEQNHITSNPTYSEPTLPSIASFNIANIHREFNTKHIERCGYYYSELNKNHALILQFREADSLLQIRIGKGTSEKITLISGNPNEGDVTLGIGSNVERFVFQLQQNPPSESQCQIELKNYNQVIKGTFICSRLSNKNRESYAASGEFSCRLDQWVW